MSDNSRPLNEEERKMFDEYLRIMKEEVIPEIVETIHRRRIAAAKSRHRIIKC